MALLRMRSRFSPRPSSLTSTTTLPESWKARSLSVPSSGLPAATRSMGVSRPWSMELRTRCISGSPMRSTMALSSSVSPPTMSRLIDLPRSRETSRTTRWKRLKVSPMGTMRSCSVPDWMPSMSCISEPTASCSRVLRVSRASTSTPAPAITSSPTCTMSSSSRSAGTRTKRAGACVGELGAVEEVWALEGAAALVATVVSGAWVGASGVGASASRTGGVADHSPGRSRPACCQDAGKASPMRSRKGASSAQVSARGAPGSAMTRVVPSWKNSKASRASAWLPLSASMASAAQQSSGSSASSGGRRSDSMARRVMWTFSPR